jgi:hypothetical protein
MIKGLFGIALMDHQILGCHDTPKSGSFHGKSQRSYTYQVDNTLMTGIILPDYRFAGLFFQFRMKVIRTNAGKIKRCPISL